jgi:uncharacterized protein (TIGR03437 family)
MVSGFLDISNSLWRKRCSSKHDTSNLANSRGALVVAGLLIWGVNLQAVNLPAPTLLSPSNGATGVSTATSFSWSAVSGAASYRILVATSAGALPSDPTASTCSCVVNDTPAGTSDAPAGLQPNTTYYWEVHARSAAEFGTWSSIYSFTTAATGGFTISASPSSQTVTQGNSTAYTVTVQSQNGFSGPVSLTVLNLPGNQVLAGTGFNPQTVTPAANGSIQSTLTIVTNSSTPTGTFSMTVQGTNNGINHTAGISITVNPGSVPDFTISATGPQTVSRGQTVTYTVNVTSINNFNSAVSLSALGLPGNQTVTGTGFSSSTVTPSANGLAQSTLTIITNNSTPTGTFSMTLQGVSAGITHTLGVSITVNPGSAPDFTISATPGTQDVTRGQNISYLVSVTSTNSFNSAVNLSVLSLPGNQALAGTGFTPSTVIPSANGMVNSTLTIATSGSTPTGTFQMTVQGVGGGITRTIGISISVDSATQITSILPLGLTTSAQSQTVSLIGAGLGSASAVILIAPGAVSKQSVPLSSVGANGVSASVTLNVVGTWIFQVQNQDGAVSNTLSVPVSSSPPSTATLLVTSNLPAATFQSSPPIPGSPSSGPYPTSFSALSGDYTVTFAPSPGYTTPAPQASAVRAGATTVFTGNYIPLSSAALASDTTVLGFSYSSSSSVASQSLPLNIRSTGRALDFTVSTKTSQGAGWLAVNITAATTPRSISVTVSGNLSPGTYMGSIIVTPAGVTSPSLRIPVLLTVTSMDFIDPTQFFTAQTAIGPIVPNPDFLNPDYAPIVNGLAADGVTRLLLRFRAPVPGSFVLSLTDGSGNSLPQPQYGTLFDKSIHTSLLGDGQYAFTVLQSPGFLPAGWTSDKTAQISYSFRADSDGSVSTGSQAFLLVRPPLILVHGLWDSAKGWTSNWGPVPQGAVGCQSSPPADAAPFICRADYNNLDTASAKLAVIAPILSTQISQYISQFRSVLRVAAIQTDVIAHSLGGLAVRTLPQCGGTFQDCSVDYFSAATYGKGIVHRLITISTPHEGTGIATIMTDGRDNICAGGFTPSDLLDLLKRPMGGALDDMAIGSGALTGIQNGRVPFPIYFYSGKASDADHKAFGGSVNTTLNVVTGVDVTVLGLLGGLEALDCQALKSSLDSFNNQPSDLLVPVSSALNGLNQDSAGTEVSSSTMIHSWAIALGGEAHYSEEERADPNLPSHLFDILKADDSVFWNPQFSSGLPISITAMAPSIKPTSSGGKARVKQLATIPAGGDFSISSPLENAVINPGTTLQIILLPTSGVQVVAADVISPAGWFHIANPGQGIFLPIPADRQGPFVFTVVGTTQAGTQTSQVRNIFVESAALIEQVTVAPTTLRLYADRTTQDGKASSSGLRVVGSFPDGSREITGSSLISYRVQNSLVARVDATGNVIAVAPGQTAIVVSYGTVQGSAVIQVNISDFRGDFNGDGVIDGYDYSLLYQAIGQPITGPDDPRDLNGDGVIDPKDLAVLSALCPSALCNASGGMLTVVNAASFVPGDLAPGEIASLFGQDISNATASATTLPLPTSLAGLEVLINNVPAPLYYVGTGQINFQVPFGLSSGTGTLAIRILGIAVVSQSVNIVAAAPGIFGGKDHGIIQNADYTLNTASNGAQVGSYVVIYFTGQGSVDAQLSSGAAAPIQPVVNTLSGTTAAIGGVASKVIFSGLTPGFVGLAQANVQIPNLAPGDYPISIAIAGSVSNASIITIK